MDDEELQRIRERRRAEVQAAAHGDDAAHAAQAAARAEQDKAQRDAVLRAILTPDARERLTRVRIARPDQAEALERQLVALAQSGRIQKPLNDEDVKAILARLFPPQRDINIRRKGSIQ